MTNTFPFTEQDTHMALWASETAEDTSTWYAWIKKVEAILGHDSDGDQAEDGYSLDNFYDQWEAGYSPERAVADKAIVLKPGRDGYPKGY
jgi:hypothetical protein